jgi:hypothetical protein
LNDSEFGNRVLDRVYESTLQLIYKNGQATINVDEDYVPSADKVVPKGKTQVIKGHRIHLVKEKQSGKTRSWSCALGAVKVYCYRIFHKLNVSNRTQATVAFNEISGTA